MRTLSELDDALDADMAWRRTEMQSLLSAVREQVGPASSCLRRGGIALLYAHWEGYTKNALSSYWKFVARRSLPYKDLSYNFVALGIERELIRTTGSGGVAKMIGRVERLMACEEDRALMTDRELDTQSNLSSSVLAELLEKLGLEEAGLATKSHFIDFNLLRSRNSIAHGEYLSVSTEVYKETHLEVLGLMNIIRGVVSNAASTGQYLRS